MPKSGQTPKQANRAYRQENLREQLAEQCRLQHLIDNLEKIEGLDSASDTFTNDLNKYKEANAQRIKLLGFYLPTLKGVEVVGEGGGAVDMKWTVEVKEVGA